VTLAEQIIDVYPTKSGWVNHDTYEADKIPIISERIDPAPGTHYVRYSSDVDDIEIIHTAHSRKGFALGAVLAAEYIANKKGVFTMANVLKLG
jgi:4-hydroxy-tetrahydrodipicolinate reductase